jgi:methionyl-tRNA formyltransferase
MKILLITSNARRHVYLANRLAARYETMVVIETQAIEVGKKKVQEIALGPSVEQHFRNIARSEIDIFGDEKTIIKPAALLPLTLGDINHNDVVKAVKDYAPDIAIVFGSGWIKEELLAYLKSIPTFNLHMGISPYYRGHSTNFWAFYRQQPEYVGGTILEINEELDKGGVICHVRPRIEDDDDYYRFSMRAVLKTIESVFEITQKIINGMMVKSTPLVESTEDHYFNSAMFTEEVAKDFLARHDKLMDYAKTVLAKNSSHLELISMKP